MTTNPPPDARNARIYVATANVAVMDILSGREQAWSTRFFPAPAVAIRAAVQMLLTVRGLPRAAWWMWAIASSVNNSAVRPASLN